MQRWAVESESGQGGWWVFELLLKTRFMLKRPRIKWRGMNEWSVGWLPRQVNYFQSLLHSNNARSKSKASQTIKKIDAHCAVDQGVNRVAQVVGRVAPTVAPLHWAGQGGHRYQVAETQHYYTQAEHYQHICIISLLAPSRPGRA